MPAMSRPLETLAQRLQIAREARTLTQTELAKKATMSQSDVSKLELGRMLKTTGIARLAAALRVPVGWLEEGIGEMPDFGAESVMRHASEELPADLAQRLSHSAPMIAPKEIEWGDVMTDKAERFTLAAEDDAMSPLLSRGQRGIFSRRAPPVAGRPVLLVDGAGEPYIREYRPRTKDRWHAVALHAGYDPLDSVADQLTIVATMVGVLWE